MKLLRQADVIFNKYCYVLRSRPSKRRLADDRAVYDWPVVIRSSPLLSTPVVALNGRPDANAKRSGSKAPRETIAEHDHSPMSLIKNARPAFVLAETRNDILARVNTVAVRFGRIGRLRERVTDREGRPRCALITNLRLQTVVISDAEVHQNIDLTDAVVDRYDRARSVCCIYIRCVVTADNATLTGRGPIERRGGVKVHGSVYFAQMLVNIIGAREQSLTISRSPPIVTT